MLKYILSHHFLAPGVPSASKASKQIHHHSRKPHQRGNPFSVTRAGKAPKGSAQPTMGDESGPLPSVARRRMASRHQLEDRFSAEKQRLSAHPLPQLEFPPIRFPPSSPENATGERTLDLTVVEENQRFLPLRRRRDPPNGDDVSRVRPSIR